MWSTLARSSSARDLAIHVLGPRSRLRRGQKAHERLLDTQHAGARRITPDTSPRGSPTALGARFWMPVLRIPGAIATTTTCVKCSLFAFKT